MANGFYAKGLKHYGLGEILWKASAGSNIRTTLVDTADYTVDLTNHEFRGTGTIATVAQEETSANMTLVDAADDFVLDASDVTFTATSGDQCEGILVYQNTGAAATDVLLFWWDTASGLPVTLGGDVTVSWDNGSNKIARV
jgi:hypothetical protein